MSKLWSNYGEEFGAARFCTKLLTVVRPQFPDQRAPPACEHQESFSLHQIPGKNIRIMSLGLLDIL
jgi:hypothetical protein